MNLTGLERRLRARLKLVTVKLFSRKLAGLSNWQTQEIHLNPLHGPILETLLHELLHLELRQELNPFDIVLEELIVDAFADKLVRFINGSKSRSAWWLKNLKDLNVA